MTAEPRTQATLIRLLVVEDNPGDARLIQEMLKRAEGPCCELLNADSLAAAVAILVGQEVDVVLSDLGLPDSFGLDTLAAILATRPDVPVVVLTGTDDEEVGARAIKAGAQDYLVKGAVDGPMIQRAIRYALERKRGLLDLAASETRYRSTIDAMNDAIHVVDSKLNIILTNSSFKRWCTDLEIDPQKTGLQIGEAFPFLSQESLLQYREVLDAGATMVTEEETTIGSRNFWTETRKIPVIADGEVTSIVTVVRDISRRKQAQRQLEEMAGEWRSTFDTMTDAVCILGPDRRILRANRAMLQVLDKTEEELIGEKCFWAVHCQDSPVEGCPYGRCLGSGSQEMLVMQVNDTWYEVRTDPLGEGDSQGVVHIMRDISDRRAAEEERRHLEAQLRQQQKMDSIGTFAGGVAHEINNPINGIMNYAQLIKDRSENNNVDEFASEIIRETERVATIVRNLLTFARLDASAIQHCRIADVIADTMSLIQTIIRKDQIDLQIDIQPDLPEVQCSSQQLQQVVTNLITNARDALNEKHSGHHPDKTVRLTAREFSESGERWVRLTVEDRGAGIMPEVKDRIMDPFFTTKPKDVGTGLGLSVSHGIIRDNGGQLSVESEAGEYARFHVDFLPHTGPEATQ